MSSIFSILTQYRGSFWVDVPRQIFGWLDSAVYGLISATYGLIEDLTRIQIFDNETLSNFYSKIYLLLTIFMLFKISFSIVSYILDPAKVSDKNSGFGKMFTNVVVMFAMLLSAPVAFKYLTKLQNAILNDNVIMNFIFGGNDGTGSVYASNAIALGDADNCKSWQEGGYAGKYYTNNSGQKITYNSQNRGYSIAKNNGDYLAVNIYRTFFNIADTKFETGNGPDNNDVKSGGGVFYFMCLEQGDFVSVSDMVSYINAYIDEVDEAGSNGYYIIEYKFGIATVVGVLALLILISIAFDVATRAIKLGFYQLIAPIPIVSYIDPKSGKNGVFNRWIKDLGKTWSSLFIRLFSLYFAVFVIQQFNLSTVVSRLEQDGGVKSSEFFIMLFVILGALIFAKQLPQIIETLIPGMKMGKMELNPFKKISNDAIGGKQLLGAAGATAGFAIGAISRTGNLAKKTVDKIKESNTSEARLKRHNQRLDRINKNNERQIDRNAERTPELLEKNARRSEKKLDRLLNKYYEEKSKAFNGETENSDKYRDKINRVRKQMEEKDKKISERGERQFEKAQTKYDKEQARYATTEEVIKSFGNLKNEMKERNEKFSNSTAGKIVGEVKNLIVQSGTILSQALTAGKIGYKGAEGLKFDVQKIGHESARVRNYKDEYNMADRFKDRATDFFGVRGSSGTSSEIANKITELNMSLDKINQSINNVGVSIANLEANPRVQGMTKIEGGRLTIDENYSGNQADMVIYNRLKELYSQQEQLFAAKQSVEKAIKKQEKIKGMPGDFKK